MDEVLADSFARLREWYGPKFQLENALEALRGHPSAEGFFRDLPVMPDSQRVIKELTKKYEIFIASAAMKLPYSLVEKYEWLQRHFPFIPYSNYVFCGNKSILNADYLIDDHAYNFEGFRGVGLLFDAPHNAHETRYRRVRGWQEVAKFFS
ncbi:MAG: 5'(3')-deoxyribonucleotidase [Hymenobacter sp.]